MTGISVSCSPGALGALLAGFDGSGARVLARVLDLGGTSCEALASLVDEGWVVDSGDEFRILDPLATSIDVLTRADRIWFVTSVGWERARVLGGSGGLTASMTVEPGLCTVEPLRAASPLPLVDEAIFALAAESPARLDIECRAARGGERVVVDVVDDDHWRLGSRPGTPSEVLDTVKLIMEGATQ